MNKVYEKMSEGFTNYWNHLLDNIPNIIIGLALFVIILILGLFIRRILTKQLVKRMDDILLVNFISRVVFTIVVLFGIMIFMGQVGWGKAASGLLAGAGVSALVLGFAFKDVGENFIAGFFLAFSRPFRIGDKIQVQDLVGIVKQMNFRTTHVRTFDGKDVFVPNAILIKDKLINFTKDGLIRHTISFGVDYSTNVPNLIQDTLKIVNEFKDIDSTESRKPFVHIKEFGSSTININLFYWTDQEQFSGSTGELNTNIMYALIHQLSELGYQMPGDIIEWKLYNEKQSIPLELIGNK